MKKYTIIAITAYLITSGGYAQENFTAKVREGSSEIAFHMGEYDKNYSDIVGDKNGTYRDLIRVDGRPALFSSSRAESIYTLYTLDGNVLIDCVYTNFRSQYSGVTVRKAVCGLNEELTPNYAEIPYKYLSKWQEQVDGLDISQTREKGAQLKIEDTTKSGFKLKTIYRTMTDLENGTPLTYIESSDLCYLANQKDAYLVYDNKNISIPDKIQIIGNEDNIITRNVNNEYISSLPESDCRN